MQNYLNTPYFCLVIYHQQNEFSIGSFNSFNKSCKICTLIYKAHVLMFHLTYLSHYINLFSASFKSKNMTCLYTKQVENTLNCFHVCFIH